MKFFGNDSLDAAGYAEYTIGVDGAVHRVITELQKSTHIKRNVVLLQGREIGCTKPGSIGHSGKVLFEEEGPGVALYNVNSSGVTELKRNLSSCGIY